MIIATTIAQVRQQVRAWRKEGLTIGLVPTMGYLHEGHASLISASVNACDRTIASVFVNPTQFGPNEDLDSYPRDFERDCALLEEKGCDLVFHPEVSELYPEGCATFVNVESELTAQLCGRTRPGHFRGVCTVVSKLFHIAAPDKAFFGQKDAQQLAVIRRMVRDLAFDIEIAACPIVREADGLAKSSRNTYLNPAERKAACVLSHAVAVAERFINGGGQDAAQLVEAMTGCIALEPLARIDYVSVVDGETLLPIQTIAPDRPVLAAVAVYIGKTRLIDNFCRDGGAPC